MYQSPYRLAGITAATISPKELQLARRRMLAELELSGGMSMELNGRSWNRQEIGAFFDSLKDDQALQFHAALAEDEPLVHFLETGRISAASWQAQPHYEAPDFRQFVSPFYAAAVNQLLKHILEGTASVEDFGALSDRPQFLLVKDAEQAFEFALRFYYRRKAAVEQMADDMEKGAGGSYKNVFDPVTLSDKLTYVTGEGLTPQDIYNWRATTNIPLLNTLPDEFFSELRYDMASGLNNLCVIADTQNRGLETGYRALQVAAEINSNEALQEIIRDNIELFKEKLNPGRGAGHNSGREKPDHNWTGIAIGLVMVIRILLGFKNCKSDEPNYTFSENSTQFVQRALEDQDGEAVRQSVDHFFNDLIEPVAPPGSMGEPAMRLKKPVAPGADPYAPLWKKLGWQDTTTMRQQKSLLFRNDSRWDAIAFCTTDGQYMRAAFLPAGSRYQMTYDGQRLFRIKIMSGRKWDGTRKAVFLKYTSTGLGIDTYYIAGGFTNIPPGFAGNPDFRRYLLEEENTISSTNRKLYRVNIEDADSTVRYSLGVDTSQTNPVL